VFFMLDTGRTVWQTSCDKIEKVQDWQERKDESSRDDLEKDVRTETEKG
jgi:hypothetical protein